MTPRLVVSVGCASGIGPEVSLAGAASLKRATVLLVGDAGAINRASRALGITPPARLGDPARVTAEGVFQWQPTRSLPPRDRVLGAPTAATGAAQLAWVDAACDLVATGAFDAMVTGPVSKDVIARSGAPGSADFLGHTEHLQQRLGAAEVVMAFWSARLTTALVTTHLPLANVPRAVTAAAVARATYWLANLLHRLGHKEPRLAIAALNPHAGEAGLLGREESRIASGIELARARLSRAGLPARVAGPIAAETAFRLAAGGEHDGVVAMYHDQATIPMKLLAFGREVNVSLGLPIIRTSVDHGTAYDRAARFDADARGMRSALRLAHKLAARARTKTGRRG
jgi:4-hydroxythreonine-4-phosphate dehydrogenase